MKRWVTPAVALVVVLLVSPDGWAGSPTEQLRGFFTAATRILDGAETQARPEQRLTTIRALVRDIFDFREAARLSLGPAWNARTPVEREEFARLFGDFVERALIHGIASRVYVADGVKVSYLGEAVNGGVASVWTTIVSKSGLDLPFDYRMIERGDRWAVRDVVIDGVSLAANYRAQFARVIQASSYPELVRQMQARVSGGLPPAPLPSPVADGRALFPIEPVLRAPAHVVTDGRALAIEPVLRVPASVVADGRALAIEPSPTMASMAKSSRAVAPPSGSRARADVTSKASAEATAHPTPSGAPPAVAGDDLALDTRSPQPQSPEPISVAKATPARATAAPPRAPEESSARGEPGVAEPLREGRVLTNQLQLVSVARSVSASASIARTYWVQVGAFRNPDAASRLAASLGGQESAGSNRWAIIVDMGSADTPLARVRIGPFAHRVEAAAALRELLGRGYAPFIAEERH